MIDGLKPYPEAKATGLSWLPSIPAHWEFHRAKRWFREVDERSERGDEELLSVSHITGVTPRSQKNVTMFMAESYQGHKLCRPGDIAVNTMWAWMAAIGVSHELGIVSPSYGVYRPRFVDIFVPRFLDYLLRTEVYRAEYVRESRGITTSRLRLYPDDFLSIPFIQPPMEEQRLIVRFLDMHGALTNRLIRAKQRIIKLLEEQKQAIIHRVVTRGLDPNVRLKPSGIPWLGDIPEHWNLTKLKHLTRFINGLAFKPSDWEGSGVPIIRIQNLNGSNTFNYTSRTDLPERLRIKSADLLFSWSGNRGTSFGSYIWDRHFEAYLNQHIFKLEGYSLHRGYFAHLLRAVTKHIEDETHGIIGLVHITKPELGSVVVPVAPDNEQEALADAIEVESAGLKAASDDMCREIALLREFRSRLVAEVVTGKLDVRAAAAALPETPLQELQQPDEASELEEEVPEDADNFEQAAA